MPCRTFFIPILILNLLATGATAEEAKLETVQAFRDAKESGELERARIYLVDNPRVWYGERDSEGSPWSLSGGGRWKAWDEFFNGRSEPHGAWHVEEDAVWVIMQETNDYYRLTGREYSRYRLTYFFAGDKIAGYMISSAPEPESDAERRKTASRFDEFAAWAKANAPEEFAALVPDGNIDPTGDHPRRMRALLLRWREAIGEPLDVDD